MTLVDVLIVFLVILGVERWARTGLARGAFSLIGFWLGLFGGALLVPYVLNIVRSPLARLLVSVAVVLVAAMLVSTLGEYAGHKLRGLLERLKLGKLDSVLGAVFSVVVTLISVWLVAAFLASTPFTNLNRQIRNSAIVRAVNKTLPPAPAVLSRIATLLDPGSFPQVFIGQEPPIAPVNPPSSAEVAAAQKAAGPSTVRIESLGCGGEVFGSGFMVAANLVVTNAHVVAGIQHPNIEDLKGKHTAQVIYFDPNLDLAVLKTTNLSEPVLPITGNLEQRGTTGAVLGYPGGGPLVINPAGVVQEIDALGRNIYGSGVVERSIYVLQTHVEPGNSGGPLVLPDGTVFGVVFGKSETNDSVGYALTSDQILSVLHKVESGPEQSANTQSCVAE